MLIEQSAAEISAAQEIQGKCALTRVAIAKCDFESFGKEGQFRTPFKLIFTHDCSGELKERLLTVLAQFNFDSVDASESPARVFRLGVSYELSYELETDCHPTPEQIDAFKRGNAVYNCWPYVREFLQNTTARMGFAPPPLPLLRVKVKQDQPKAAPAPAVVKAEPEPTMKS
jgi:hypothetical protein